MMMVDDNVLRRVKKEVYGLLEDVEEIDVVEDGISVEEIGRRLVKIDCMVNEVIVDNFMGDDEDE
jgi:hypothetical protein